VRLDKLWIGDFKNLKDFVIDFAEERSTTVLIGHNGTGKSNLLEALVVLFRDLDLGERPRFAYKLDYLCREHKVSVDADPKREAKPILVRLDGSTVPVSRLKKGPQGRLLPSNTFAYYSGPSNRLEALFDDHQRRFRNALLEGQDQPLRPLFCARAVHSQFVLLSFFSFEDEESASFLGEYLGIDRLNSVRFVLKEPPWKSPVGDSRFWNARGVVSELLGVIYDHALAPAREHVRARVDYTKSREEERLHLHLPDQATLRSVAGRYGSNREFFKVLESLYMSDLVHEVQISVHLKSGVDITFAELSEGERQLLTVLGLLRFTEDEESLFLLDEPDTHLNPAWKQGYIDLLRRVVKKPKSSQLIMCTHDPLVMSGLTRDEVRVFQRDPVTGRVSTLVPEEDPRGMGVAALLTSELFGLRTTLDTKTQKLLDRKRDLFLKNLREGLSEDELGESDRLSRKLGALDFTRTIRDPMYEKFVSALMRREEFKKPVLTPDESHKLEDAAQDIVKELLEAEKR
jgi:predicted ATPase